MPGQTPIYGLLYPCSDEPITPAAFQILANQIDAKLLELQGDYTLMLNRYNYDIESVGPQNIAAGADTVLTGAGLTYTIPMSGVYVVRARSGGIPSGAFSMMRVRVRQNGVVRFGQTSNTEGNTLVTPVAIGPIVAVAGDVITAQFLYAGAGTVNVFSGIDVKMLVRTA